MKISKYYWFVISGATLSGLVVFGGQVLSSFGLSLAEISIIPFIISLVVLIPVIVSKRGWKINKQFLPLMIFYGFVEAIIILCEFGALKLGASVATTVFLLYTQPLWTMIFSSVILKEKISRQDIYACLLVLVGILLLANPLKLQGALPGIIVALVGGLGLSGWVVLGSYASKKNIPPLSTYFISRLFMLIFLSAIFFIMPRFTQEQEIIGWGLNFSIYVWLAIALFGIVAELFNNLCYLKGVEKVPTMKAGIIMLLEPIVGAILATIFLHQPMTLGIIIGGALILSANYLVIRKEDAK
ncbi:MAG: DMT family transporter [Patescibacteria group bacterium]|jgi:drug/metabolite transporter (DMT)-like permease